VVRPSVQPPVVRPPVEPPLVSPPVVRPPVVSSPDAPGAESSVTPAAQPIPWLWPVAATLTLLTLLVAGLLTSRAVRTRQGHKAAHTDIRVVAGADFGSDVTVMQSRADRSSPTCVVRIEPHADSGTQVVEEVYQ
jgi:hypothetical protein